MKRNTNSAAANVNSYSVNRTASKLLGRLAVMASVLLIAAASLQAQSREAEGKFSNKYAHKNLEAGIKSDNLGVRRDAIYYAGKYQLSDVLFALMEQLREEKDPETKVLLALSLRKLNDARGLYLVKELSVSDKNDRVRRMCTAIYNDYLVGRAERYADK